MINNHHAHLSISSLYVYLGSWIFISSLQFLKLAKIDFRLVSSADLDLHHGYNRREK